MNRFIKAIIIVSILFIHLSHADQNNEAKDKAEVIEQNTENNNSTKQDYYVELGESTMQFMAKNWVKIACPTVGLSLGLSLGARMAEDYGPAAIASSAAVGITAGWYIGKKISEKIDKKNFAP